MTAARRAKISRIIKARWRSGAYSKLRRRRSSGSRAIVVSRRRSVRRAAAPIVVTARRSRSRRSYAISRRRVGGGGLSRGLAPSSLSGFLGVFNRKTITIAAGAATAGLATSYVLSRFGANLPGANTVWGNAAYRVGIPILGAWAVHKHNRDFADGLVIGGMVMLVNMVIGQFMGATAPAAAPAATAAYPVSPASPLHSMGEYLDPVGDSVFDSNSAFATDAWA